MSAVAVSSTQILLTWASVPEQDQNGLILGYKVRAKAPSLCLSCGYLHSDPCPLGKRQQRWHGRENAAGRRVKCASLVTSAQ